MKQNTRRLTWFITPVLVFCVVFMFLASRAATDPSKDQKEQFHLSILHTNDLHAHDEQWTERGRQQGGLPRIGHMIRLLKKQEPKALVIDAGDIFQGTPMYSKYHGEVEVTLLNMIGYDIYTIGNHEFDDGPQNLADQLKKAKFSIINCNMDCTGEPELAALIKPYVIREIDGQKVAFIGAITPELNSMALRTGKVKVTPGPDWMKPIQDQIKAVKDQGINKIVLVTHVGLDCDKQLGALPDVDVIIGGHSHTRLEQPVVIPHPDGSSAVIVQTGSFARALGKLEVAFDGDGRVIVPQTEYRLINITNKVFQDKDLLAYVDKEVEPLLPLRNTIAGVAKSAFDNTFRSMPWDSALGDVICDALAESGQKYGAKISFENRGGIRGRIEPGPISLEEIEEILPFENHFTLATVPGDTLLKVLEHSVDGALGGHFLDNHGLKLGYDPKKEPGKRIVFVLAETASGEWLPVKTDEKYKIAINDYTFGGGEGYDFKTATSVEAGNEKMSDIFKHYLANHHDIAPGEPTRIIPLDSGLLTAQRTDHGVAFKVRNAPPNARVIFVGGKDRGISDIGSEVFVPLSAAKVLGRATVGEDGSCDYEAPKVEAGTYVSAVALPSHGTAGKKVVGYPLLIQ